MHEIISKIISFIKKENFNLDKRVPLSYLIALVIEKLFALIRGTLIGLFIKRSGGLFFVGKDVRISAKAMFTVGRSVVIERGVVIDALSKNGIIFGDYVKIGCGTIIQCTGTIKSLGKGLVIGNRVGMGEYCFFGAAGGIEIGNDVIMGQNIRFHSQNHNFDNIDLPIRLQGTSEKGIKIGNDCWIGAGAVFLDGVSVGDGCVIGANALVNRDIPSGSVAVGNPVKIIKQRGI